MTKLKMLLTPTIPDIHQTTSLKKMKKSKLLTLHTIMKRKKLSKKRQSHLSKSLLNTLLNPLKNLQMKKKSLKKKKRRKLSKKK